MKPTPLNHLLDWMLNTPDHRGLIPGTTTRFTDAYNCIINHLHVAEDLDAENKDLANQLSDAEDLLIEIKSQCLNILSDVVEQIESIGGCPTTTNVVKDKLERLLDHAVEIGQTSPDQASSKSPS